MGLHHGPVVPGGGKIMTIKMTIKMIIMMIMMMTLGGCDERAEGVARSQCGPYHGYRRLLLLMCAENFQIDFFSPVGGG